ncbi:hypothetical protein QJQ45_012375 [Haematococcus lacustris]|nr:hypothetical protein QJQ45_012375 [Haematococcus lacustris]
MRLLVGPPRPFDFVVAGQLLRQPLEALLMDLNLSAAFTLPLTPALALAFTLPLALPLILTLALTLTLALILTLTLTLTLTLALALALTLALALALAPGEGPRCTHSWTAHPGGVNTVASAALQLPGRKQAVQLVASGGKDHAVCLWQVDHASDPSPTHHLLASCRGHTDSVECVALSPDTRHLASCGWDGALLVWRAGQAVVDAAAEAAAVAKAGGGRGAVGAAAAAPAPVAKRRKGGQGGGGGTAEEGFAPEGGVQEEVQARLQGHIHCVAGVAWATQGLLFSGGWDHSPPSISLRVGIGSSSAKSRRAPRTAPAQPASMSRRDTQLMDLSWKLLGAVIDQLHDRDSRLSVFRASKDLARAVLQHTPAVHLTFPTEEQYCEVTVIKKPLAPFLVDALRFRQRPLRLKLEPDRHLLLAARGRMLAARQVFDATMDAVELCPAVNHLTITALGNMGGISLWKPMHNTALVNQFTSLTSLTLGHFITLTASQLHDLVSHQTLSQRLQHLDIRGAHIINPSIPGLFVGSRLQGLVNYDEAWTCLPHLAPLAPFLTQLTLYDANDDHSPASLAAAVVQLTCLRSLHLDTAVACFTDVLPLLTSLTSLHTLELPRISVAGQEQVDALLAATQITRLQLRKISGMTASKASTACNWQQLCPKDFDWSTAAYLPLHSLTHPLHILRLDLNGDTDDQLVAAAERNLCVSSRAGVVVESMVVSGTWVDRLALTHNRPLMQLLGPCVEFVKVELSDKARPSATWTTLLAVFPRATLQSV